MSVPRKGSGYKGQRQLYQALGHSLRIDLLFALLEDGPTSASRFANKHRLGKGGLSRVSYHLKVLMKNELVVVKERNPRRGAIETVYEANANSPVLGMVLASMNGYAELNHKEHARTLLKVVHLDVDDRGVEEVKEAIRGFRAHLDQAETASRRRHNSSSATPRHLQVVYTDVDSRSAT
jgi:DNA-binding transcriptional ArsR family regulator